MSTISFNDDLSIDLPYGWASAELWEEGKKVLRIAGPDAGGYLSGSKEYDCELRLSVSKENTTPVEGLDFAGKLREMSEKAGEVKISISVNGRSSNVGGSGFDRKYEIISDTSNLKSGYFTMGVVGKTLYIGVIITDRALYTITTMKSGSLASVGRHLPELMERIALLHEPLSAEEREQQRLRREQEERERREREAAQRRRAEEEARKKADREAEARRAYEEACGKWEKQKQIILDQREQELKNRVAAFEKGKRKALEETRSAELKAARELCEQGQSEAEAAAKALEALGFFQFGEKKEQKRRLEEAQKKLARGKSELENAKNRYDQATAELRDKVNSLTAELRAEIEKKLPLPIHPLPTDFSDSAPRAFGDAERQMLKADILAFMKRGTMYTAGDIFRGVPSLTQAELTINRVSALLQQLLRDGAVDQIMDKRTNYYCLR